MEDYDEVKQLATYSLGQLLQKEASAALGVRAVYRCATLKRHTRWQMWAFLQLYDLKASDKEALVEAKLLFEEAFPKDEDQATRDNVIENVVNSYLKDRRNLAGDKFLTSSIDHVEALYKVEEECLLREPRPHALDRLARLIRIIVNTKNNAQNYLMSLERGGEPPKPTE